MIEVKLRVNRLNFVVEPLSKKAIEVMANIEKALTTYLVKWNNTEKRVAREADKVYFIYEKNTGKYRLPIVVLKAFFAMLAQVGIDKEKIEYTYVDPRNDIKTVKFGWNPDYIPRDYQEEYVNAVMSNLSNPIFLIDLFTGGGKGLVACRIFLSLQYRVGIFILPKYIKKWIAELKLLLKLKNDDIWIIQGEDSLLAAMEDTSPKFKIAIFSIPTMQSYISSVEEEEGKFPMPPEDLMRHLGIGVMFNDETHQHFHAVTTIMLYSTCYYFIGSTATLISNNVSLEKVYNIIIPKKFRIANIVGYQAYITTIPVGYRIAKALKKHRLNYRRAQGYNHNLLEQSILSIWNLKKDYYEMVYTYIENKFLDLRVDKKKDKVVIYFASIAMCDDFTKYLKSKLPKENIMRYIGGDDYNKMLKSNLIVSNNNMLGTAIDIPNLITVIQTVSMRSLQANIQNFGRLRRIKDRELYYVYFYCMNMQEQIKLHTERIRALEERSEQVKYEYYTPTLMLY